MIQQLSEDLVLKIAAGEVIERPASVIKELLENSLDAKATSLVLEIGKVISILDNGTGMSKEDLKICYLRHTTSKLRSVDDLFNINSLGFRGEALASIAAVSHIEIISKRKEDSMAHKLVVIGGEFKELIPAAFPYDSGTEIIVSDLFFNTPARKKYMKTDATEQRVMLEVVQQYALANPKLGFKVISGVDVLLHTNPANLKDRFYQIYGKDSVKEMLEITENTLNEIGIFGLLSKPALVRKSRSDQYLFVNGRSVKSRVVYGAITDAYKGFLNTGEQPVVVLFLSIDPHRVDVNVHPTKQEIKFDDDQLLYRAVFHTIKETLIEKNTARTIEFKQSIPQKSYTPVVSISNRDVSTQSMLFDSAPQYGNAVEEVSGLKVLALFQKEFILAEKDEKLVIIDFHAAAEIVNYERFSKQFAEGVVDSQSLIEPVTLDVPASEVIIVKENEGFFKQLGFFVEQFGPTNIIIRTVPTIFGKTLEPEFIRQLLSELKDGAVRNSLEKKKDAIITRMSCRASEKAGDDLSVVQAQKILRNLFSLEGNSYNCPHGRPTIIEFSKYDLEKMFKRIR